MARTKAFRKFQLTINNPLKYGYSHEDIKSRFSCFKGITYWCLSDEIGDNGTPHTHIYIAFNNAVEFDNIQRHFYGAHIESAKGSHKENRDYILKEGKWENTSKSETSIEGSFEESGDLPGELNDNSNQSAIVLQMIKDGFDNEEIISRFPSQMNHLKNIEYTRQMIKSNEYKNVFRNLDVFYIWGQTGVGKTRSIMEQYGYENVYRVTNYKNPFDGYKGEDIILFDEFRSSLPITDMLNYLDGYPIELPCRYSDKVACYTKAYVVSNISFDEQYPNVQENEPETFKAFKRRFNGGIFEKLSCDIK